MTYSEKIEEWIKEAETRPGSALMILKLIAGRLRDLTARNEELLAENIALQDGSRVQEYEQRIANLEFQLELLKRRFGSNVELISENRSENQLISLLIYNTQGQIIRLALSEPVLSSMDILGHVVANLVIDDQQPRFLAVPSKEEVMLLFSSGRVSSQIVTEIPEMILGQSWNWQQAVCPDAPHAGESLVCLMPLSYLPVSDFFLQASRRGFVKKTTSSIFEKVLSTRYLGGGTIQKNDEAFEVLLGIKKSLFVLVSHEGRLLCLDVDGLSFASEERIHLNAQDHLVAAFLLEANQSILFITQTGKVIQRDVGNLEIAKSSSARGQAIIPPSRLEQGTRFIGAVPYKKDDKVALMDKHGTIKIVSAVEISNAGSIRNESLFIAMGKIPSMENGGTKT